LVNWPTVSMPKDLVGLGVLDLDKFDRASDCAAYGKNGVRRTSHGSAWKFRATRQIDYFSMPPPSYPSGRKKARF